MAAARQAHRQFMGVVVSAGKMMKTVRVRIADQEWNKHIRKHFQSPFSVLVSDPASSLRQGDIITLQSGWRTSKHVRHVVTSIVAPFGTPLSDRPAIPTEEERLAARDQKRAAKDERRVNSENPKAREAARRRIEERRQSGGRPATAGLNIERTDAEEEGGDGQEPDMNPLNRAILGRVQRTQKFAEKAERNEAELERFRGDMAQADDPTKAAIERGSP